MIKNLCPHVECRSELAANSDGALDTWVCPKGHGFAATVSELWGRLQDDEIDAIWTAAKSGQPTDLLSPGLGQPMVSIEVLVDDDEEKGNTGENATKVRLDVAVEEQFIWFDLGEWEVFPADLANAQPTAEEQGKIDAIATQFANSWGDAIKQRNNTGLKGLANRFANTADPHGSVSRAASKVIPGKSAEEVIRGDR